MAEALLVEDKSYQLDKHGYLEELDNWSKAVAEALAANSDLVLTAEHWELITLLRKFHRESGLLPSTRVLVKLMARELGPDRGKSLYLMKLFPQKPLKTACKIAGLPRPTNCV